MIEAQPHGRGNRAPIRRIGFAATALGLALLPVGIASSQTDRPAESVPVPAPGSLTPGERTEAVLRALAQITSTDRTASAWLLRGRELRLQTPGSVTFGRPNPATSPASAAVRIRFD